MKLIYFYLIVTPFSKKLQRITLSSVLNTGSQLQDALMLLLFFLSKNSDYFLTKKENNDIKTETNKTPITVVDLTRKSRF